MQATHLAKCCTLTPGLHLKPTPLGRGEVGGGGAVTDLLYPMIPSSYDDVLGSTIAIHRRWQVEFAYDGGPLELSRFGSYERRYQEP